MAQHHGPENESEILAKLMVKYGLATREQVSSALAVAREEEARGASIPLGTILLQMGVVNEKQLQTLRHLKSFLLIRRQDRQLAEAVLQSGFSTPQHIDTAIRMQSDLFQKSRRICRLSEILLQEGMITPEQLEVIQTRGGASAAPRPVRRVEEQANGANGPQAVPDTNTTADRQPAPGDDQPTATMARRRGVELRVSDDGLRAILVLTGPLADGTSLAQVYSLLKEHGVLHGIIEEKLIEDFLKSPIEDENTLEVARGVTPLQGKEGKIEFFFETDPLKIGALKSGEHIDFKDRGLVPQVKEGELLARLTPTLEGRDGCDVYGRKTPVPRTKKLRLQCGEGVLLSDDKLEARAKRAGQPKLTVDGRIIVEPEYIVREDVSLETGHIDFDGNICVYGAVQDGFRVRGGSLSAREIMQAEIDTTGDVVVTEGIIGAKIKTRGHVRAKFIQGAEIEARGDIVASTTIIHSNLRTSGTCSVRTGKVLASTVQAKRGIEARQIGSERSKPCQLVVGVDERLDSELAALRAAVKKTTRHLTRTENALRKLNGLYDRIELKIGRMVQKQDDVLREIRALEEEAAELESVDNEIHREQLNFGIQELQNKYQTVEAKMTDLTNRQSSPVRAKINTVKERVAEIRSQLTVQEEKLESLTAWARENPPVPTVTVYGTIQPGTQIRAAHCSVKIKSVLGNVIIKESRSGTADNAGEWRMGVRSLRQ